MADIWSAPFNPNEKNYYFLEKNATPDVPNHSVVGLWIHMAGDAVYHSHTGIQVMAACVVVVLAPPHGFSTSGVKRASDGLAAL